MKNFCYALLLILLVAGPGVDSIHANSRPNVIFILADDWGLGDVKAYGGDTCKIATPHMDRLAAKGMKFTDAHSSSSVCTPTRYGVLTGRYNWRSRLKSSVLFGYSDALIKEGQSTVPSFLKEQGYHTACIGKWHLGMTFPTTDGKPANSTARKPEELKTKCNVNWKGQIKRGPNSIGFDQFWGISASLDMPPYIWIQNDRFVGECTTIKAFHRPGPAHKDFEDYDVLPTLAKKAVAYVTEQAKTDAPFFMYMPLNSPHTPISPSKPFRGKSKLGKYGDFVMETDWAIGQVVEAVEKAGITRNTLIIVTADNGCSPAASRGIPKGLLKFRMGKNEPADPDGHYASHLYRGHKADIYEGGHRVPFLARWDGKIKAGSVNDNPICLVDLYATCADLLNKKPADDAAADSVSFLPHLLGTAKGPIREAVVHHSINGSFAIRQGKWKLAFCPGSGGWSLPRPTRSRGKKPAKPVDTKARQWVQLYDLSTDPAETRNLAADNPKVVAKLTKLAKKYISDGRSTAGPKQSNEGETHLYPSWFRKQMEK